MECGHGFSTDFLGSTGGGDGEQQTSFLVELDQRHGVAVVGFEADENGLGAIVLALKELAVTNIASAGNFGRAFGGMEDGFALFASEATAEARDDVAGRQLIIDDGGERQSLSLQQFAERYGLLKSAWEAIEDETTATTEALGALANHVEDRGIGNKIAAAHVLESGFHGGSEVAFVAILGSAKNIASGEMTGVEKLIQEGGLRSLPDTRGAEKNEPPWIRDGSRKIGTSFRGPLEPASAIVLVSVVHGVFPKQLNVNVGEGEGGGCDRSHADGGFAAERGEEERARATRR